MDKYVKVRKIGEGAFGKAELVKRKKDGSQMVIKEINIMRMGPKEREEARKEVAVLAQLSHPSIVAYRESFEEHGSLYIVMDYCAGGDLYAKINSQRGILFPEDQILDWFVQMCLAIKHIHDRKILHRDIKSQNIFLTSKGMVQLGDFGIAKVLNNTAELARTCIGTPYYLSPEIVENKPYNNKSDIWSLGCVLYELATLKHAFEAGNMKNLVLKIIRGSYPPVSPKYSYELRNLVAQLFKRTPRDRPSINSVLKKPFVSQRVPKFLSEEQIQSEFSHTVMHGHKLGRALPPPPNQAARPPSASRNRGNGVGAAAAAGVKKYDPSKVYGAPLVRKSKENKAPADVRKRPGSAGSRPGSAAGSRPGSAAGSRPGSARGNRPSSSQEIQKKRQELQEKEKKRREEMQRKEYERRHREIQERQKIARMNKAREEGWSNLVSSLDSDSGKEQKPAYPKEIGRKPQVAAPPAPPRPYPGGDYNANAAQKDRGKYDHYNQYLDRLQQDREVRQRQDNVPTPAPAAAYMGAPRPVPGAPQPAPVWRKAPQPSPVYTPYNNKAQQHQQERAKLVDDFILRRQEAAVNKQRGQAQLFGPSPHRNDPQRPPSAGGKPGGGEPAQRPGSASSRNREEQEYLEKLRQIRQQNYQERRNLQARAQADRNPELAAEERKKKAEALKKQAEDWAKQRKDVLEQKRQELMEKEKHMREVRQNMNRPVPAVKPCPAVPMTGAVNAIGATPRVVSDATPQPKAPAMTGILGAIGAVPNIVEEEEEARAKTPIQKQKDEILRKLNEKGPPVEPEEPQESARSKWSAGKGEFKLAIHEEEDAERPRWGTPAVDLSNMKLEETGSQMEVTSARDRVIVNPDSARRQWGGGGQTVLRALQEVPIADGTMASNKSEESVSSPVSTDENPTAAAAKGSTITISKSPVRKGTITIRTAEENKAKDIANINQNDPSPESANQKPSSTSPVKETEEEAESRLEPEQSEHSVKPCTAENQSQVPEVKGESGPSGESQKPPLPARKPVVAEKPPLAEKPLMFPKPVLLPKPDKPAEFVSGRPVEVKNEGAGSLFEKVELENEEEPAASKPTEDKADTVVVKELSDEGVKKKTGLVLGITMGSFDIGHSELLRTCSEPDLSNLGRTAGKGTANIKVRSLDDMTVVIEEDDDNLAAVYDSMEKASRGDNQEEEKEEEKDVEQEAEQEEEEAEEEDEDIADLMSVRATMQSLLLDDSEEEKQKSPVKFSLSSDVESRGDTNDGDIEDTEEEDGDHVNSDDDVDAAGEDSPRKEDGDDQEDDGAEGSDEEEEEEGAEEDNEDKTEGEQDETDSGVQRSYSVDNENPQTPDERDVLSDLFQTDESDSEFNDGDDAAADFDLFGRLEESRAKLEEELGAEKLIQVYKTVQALQEDEDENMEEGARIAQELLGKDKEHLYPKIFQLVMADTAFTDDNLL